MLFSDQEIIQLEDGELRFWPQFLDWESAQQYFEAVKNETPWEQSQITIAGRKIAIPRLNAWYGDAGADYGYSGVKLRTRAFTPQLVALRNRVEKTTECGF